MNFKKRVNGSWTDTSHYIHNTSTDTLTTLPADVYANDTTATVGLKGQMEQSGTPSPTNPIQPQECGDLSSNLWSYHPDTTSGGVRLLWDGEKINYSNTCTYASNSIMTINLKKGTYTLKVNANRIPVENDYSCIDIYHPSSGLLKQVTNRNAVNGKVTFTLDDDLSNVSLRIRLDNGTNYDGFEIRPMLNIGETSLPYDVYGQYKIPILSNSTTTPVYLGEVESTRLIKKLVLTGQETYGITSNNIIYHTPFPYTLVASPSGYSSHYTYYSQSQGPNMPLNSFTTRGGAGTSLWFKTEYTSVDDFKAYLAQQYANGTPVTIWYVLAAPQTAVVNEPLRKIGTYADEVSGITIPTIAGANTLSVDTTLQPSEVSVNYKGWHPVTDVHEKSRNLFDVSTATLGKYIDSNGNEATSTASTPIQALNHTDYIEIQSNTNYTYHYKYSNGVINTIALCWFDASKNLISRNTKNVYEQDKEYTLTGTSPANAAFCIINFVGYLPNASMELSFNSGATPLPYEPYWT